MKKQLLAIITLLSIAGQTMVPHSLLALESDTISSNTVSNLLNYAQQSLTNNSYDGCIEARNQNNALYPNFLRTDCFRYDGGYRYFIYTSDKEANVNTILGTSSGTTVKTTSSTNLPSSITVKLDAFINKIRTQGESYNNPAKYEKLVDTLIGKLSSMKPRLTGNQRALSIVSYLETGLNNLKDDDLMLGSILSELGSGAEPDQASASTTPTKSTRESTENKIIGPTQTGATANTNTNTVVNTPITLQSSCLLKNGTKVEITGGENNLVQGGEKTFVVNFKKTGSGNIIVHRQNISNITGSGSVGFRAMSGSTVGSFNSFNPIIINNTTAQDKLEAYGGVVPGTTSRISINYYVEDCGNINAIVNYSTPSPVKDEDFVAAGFKKPTITVTGKTTYDYLEPFSIKYTSEDSAGCEIFSLDGAGIASTYGESYYMDGKSIKNGVPGAQNGGLRLPGALPATKTLTGYATSIQTFRVACWSPLYSLYGTGTKSGVLLDKRSLGTYKDVKISINGCQSAGNYCQNQSELENKILSFTGSKLNTGLFNLKWNIDTSKVDLSKCSASFTQFSGATGDITMQTNSDNAYYTIKCEHPAGSNFLGWKGNNAQNGAIMGIEKNVSFSSNGNPVNSSKQTVFDFKNLLEGSTPITVKNIAPGQEVAIPYNTVGYKNCWFEDRKGTNSIIGTNPNFYSIDYTKPTGTIIIKPTKPTGYVYGCDSVDGKSNVGGVFSIKVGGETVSIEMTGAPLYGSPTASQSTNTTITSGKCSGTTYVSEAELKNFNKCSVGTFANDLKFEGVVNSHATYSYSCLSSNGGEKAQCNVSVSEVAKNGLCKQSNTPWIFGENTFNPSLHLCSVGEVGNVTRSTGEPVENGLKTFTPGVRTGTFDYKYDYTCKGQYGGQTVSCSDTTIRLYGVNIPMSTPTTDTTTNNNSSNSSSTITNNTQPQPLASVPSRTQQIEALYQSILGRAPDPTGLNYWVNSGVPIEQIRAEMLGSREYRIRDLYLTLLDRQPDLAGFKYWNESGLTIERIRQEFLNSAEYKAKHP